MEMESSNAHSGAGAACSGVGSRPLQVPVGDKPSMTSSSSSSEDSTTAMSCIDRCRKPASGSSLLGLDEQACVFRAEFGRQVEGAEPDLPTVAFSPIHIMVKAIMNRTDPLTSLEPKKGGYRQTDLISSLPTHRNIVRLIFEGEAILPAWMLVQLPAAWMNFADDDCSRPEMPAEPQAFAPRPIAKVLGLELPEQTLRDHLASVEEGAAGSLPDDVLVQLSKDVADGVHHLLQHGVVHLNLSLDSLKWDSKGDPDGSGRVVLSGLDYAFQVDTGDTCLEASKTQVPGAAAARGKEEAKGAAEAAAQTHPLAEHSGPGTEATTTRTETSVGRALNLVTYGELRSTDRAAWGNQAHLAPEVLDGWSQGAAGDDDAIVPLGKQASWALGVLLHELATGGQHPFGDAYPLELRGGRRVPAGGARTVLARLEKGVAVARGDRLAGCPPWFIDLVEGLLQCEEQRRTGVRDACTTLQQELERLPCWDKASQADTEASRPLEHSSESVEAQVRPLLAPLAGEGPMYGDAVSELHQLLSSMMRGANWTGVYRALMLLHVEFGAGWAGVGSAVQPMIASVRHALQKMLLEDARQLQRLNFYMAGRCAEPAADQAALALWHAVQADGEEFVDHLVLSGAVHQLVGMLSSTRASDAECAALAISATASKSGGICKTLIDLGSLPKLVGLLRSDKNSVVEAAVGALRCFVNDSNESRQQVVDTGVLPGLVALLGSREGREREFAAELLRDIAAGTEEQKKQVVDAGALPGLVALLGSSRGTEAELGAKALYYIVNESNRRRQEVVDAGALPGLVALLGMSKGAQAEYAAEVLRNIVCRSQERKDQVLRAGALPHLVSLLGSDKGREAEHAAGALRLIVIGSDERKRQVVDAGATLRLVAMLGSGKGMEAELGAGVLRNIAVGSDERKQDVVNAGALPGLVALLGSDKGKEAEQGAGTLANIAVNSVECKQHVVEAGAVPGLVALLGSDRGMGRELCARALRSITAGTEDHVKQVVDAGALPGLVALLGSSEGKEAQIAADAIGNIADGSDERKQQVADAGAAPGLVGLLGSAKGREAEMGAAALQGIVCGPDELKQLVVDAGALPCLVALMGSRKCNVVWYAMQALQKVQLMSENGCQSVVDSGVLPALVVLLGSAKEDVRDLAVEMLAGIALLSEDLLHCVRDAGAIPRLEQLRDSGQSRASVHACNVLSSTLA